MSEKTPKQLALTEKSKRLRWPESVIEVYENIMREVSQISAKLSKLTKYYINGVEEVQTKGGAALEEFSLPWAKASYHVLAQIKTKGESPVSITAAHCETGKVVVEFSDDPGSDHIVTLLLI